MKNGAISELLDGHPVAVRDFLMSASHLWVIVCERSGRIVELNKAASIALAIASNRSVHELITSHVAVPRLAPGERASWSGELEDAGSSWLCSGSWFGLKQHLILVADHVETRTQAPAAQPTSAGFASMASDMEETNRRLHEQNAKLVAANRSMSMLANTDPLTGLHNRRYFDAQTSRLEAAAKRSDGGLAAMVCDIDHFKRINDTHGHGLGDAMLKTFADTLTSRLRAEDVAIRWGGEEFVVLMPKMTLDHAEPRAESIRRVFAASRTRGVSATVSIGVGQMEVGEDLVAFINRVDASLYQAKHEGRNRVVASRKGPRRIDPSTALAAV